ncbi:hypothetical protein E3N88_14478 [Mikania micrantha]|uniref:Uncharacterized protein n=1 Tax=Mikania micrantha TaxID=192012 RepID=A0A5N6P2T9_9ASTR|nr:hypothetical protein E3N88_14478 [Mikania micrantha]
MDSKHNTTANDSTTVSKRKRSASESPPASTLPVKPPQELVSKEFKRQSLTINPDFVDGLRAANIIGYARPISQILPTTRYYTINVDTFRETVTRFIEPYIKRKLYELDSLAFDEVDNVLSKIVPAITNACMAAFAISAVMFARADDDGEALAIIQHLADDKDYPFRLREAPDGDQLRAFGALRNAPCQEWI